MPPPPPSSALAACAQCGPRGYVGENREGSLVCFECGAVVEEQCISTRPEWRNFEDTTVATTRARCGHGPVSGGTRVVGPGEKLLCSASQRLHLDGPANTTRQLVEAVRQLSQLPALQLSGPCVRRAEGIAGLWMRFRQTVQIEPLALAAMFIACQARPVDKRPLRLFLQHTPRASLVRKYTRLLLQHHRQQQQHGGSGIVPARVFAPARAVAQFGPASHGVGPEAQQRNVVLGILHNLGLGGDGAAAATKPILAFLELLFRTSAAGGRRPLTKAAAATYLVLTRTSTGEGSAEEEGTARSSSVTVEQVAQAAGMARKTLEGCIRACQHLIDP